MTTHRRAPKTLSVYIALTVLSAATAASCAQNAFTGQVKRDSSTATGTLTNTSPNLTGGNPGSSSPNVTPTPGPNNGQAATTLPVGMQQTVANILAQNGINPSPTTGTTGATGTNVLGSGGNTAPTNCVSSNPTIAAVNPQTCVITALAPGQTNVTATLPNGTTQNIAVNVTPNNLGNNGGTGLPAGPGINTDASNASGTAPQTGLTADGASITPPPGSVVSSDGIITQVSGMLCLGGPACNVSYLLGSAADAQTCMAVANAQTCANDSGCDHGGPPIDLLHVCYCTCTSPTGFVFDQASACRRFNPLHTGGKPPITACQGTP